MEAEVVEYIYLLADVLPGEQVSEEGVGCPEGALLGSFSP